MTCKLLSRRAFLKTGAVSGSAVMLGSIVGTAAAPPAASVEANFLAARLQWDAGLADKIILTVSTKRDLSEAIVHVELPGNVNTYPLAVVPEQTYYWSLETMGAGRKPTLAARGTFTSGAVRLVEDAPWSVQFKNPRPHAHFVGIAPGCWDNPYDGAAEEPLSPWYDVKRYTVGPPKFAELREKLPQPILDGHPDALDTYWYCWRTFVEVWNYAPSHPNHQAVANINGYPTWAGWGSAQVLDSAYMMYFARYGHQAYPFIQSIDNVYARQHENGFICQESDNDNFEVYSGYPAMTPFLNAWMEWNYYRVSGDAARLRRVLMPLVKNYEWFMTCARRKSDAAYGMATPASRAYATDPFNEVFPYTSLRAIETLAMARIAKVAGRPDLARFFTAEHQRLGKFINQRFWDSDHELYNDRCDPNHMYPQYRDASLNGKFLTEIKPGVFDKSVWTFAPVVAEIAPPERVQALARLLQDPGKGFNQPNGPTTYSADSNPPGAAPGDLKSAFHQIWPPFPCMIQQGFTSAGQRAVAQALAEKYFAAMVQCYTRNKTINESLSPTTLDGWGQPNFVGWGGIGPIANFIEYVLGFDIDAPQNTVTWHLHRMERHGLRNIKIGACYVDFLCDARAKPADSCRLTVQSDGAFTLSTVLNGKRAQHHVARGTTLLDVG
jgi:hypothetical protein